jgi:8-oxo-dGTP diphosphatase
MRYNGVIFDFNGTLLFDDPYHDIAWGKVAREVCGQDVDGHELVSKYSGYPNIEILRDISGGTLTDEQLEYYSLRKEALYREIVRSVPGGASLAPGAVELFDYLKEHGIPCVIASASIIQNIEFFVETFHLDRWFDMDHIVYDDNSYKNKEMMFREALRRIGADEGILIFEDSPSGISGAANVGASVVAIRKESLESFYEKIPQIIDVVEDFRGAERYFEEDGLTSLQTIDVKDDRSTSPQSTDALENMPTLSSSDVVEDKPTIRVVAAVIRDGDRIYATQRGYGEYKDGWEFPGGKIEPGETPEEALVREIREELAVTIEVGEKISTIEYDYPKFHLSMDCFWCRIVDGEIHLQEHEAARWLTQEDLAAVDWLPADRRLIAEMRCLATVD